MPRSSELKRLDSADESVHLWRGSLDVSAAEFEQFNRYLSSDEHERAARFRFPVHRDRFVACRGLLRAILARYLDCEPASVSFEYSRFGKPSLKDAGFRQLQFNLAHCEGYFALAISEHPVGVDLELMRPIPDVALLANEVFSTAELNETAEAGLSVEKFLRLWTRKEALLKAIGCGITEHVKNVSVFFESADPIAVPSMLSSARWSLKTIADDCALCSVASTRFTSVR